MKKYLTLYLGRVIIHIIGKRVFLYHVLSQAPLITEVSSITAHSMVLTNSLESFAKDNQLIDNTHIGFKKVGRTVDHMFILTTLIDK